MNYIAHKRSETDNAEQLLIDHLVKVSELSGEFAECLELSEYAEIIGMMHDIGKYSNRFQERINGNDKIKVDHSTSGAQEAFKRRLLIAAFCIAGHHGGIPDIGGRADRENDSTLQGRLKKNTENYSAWIEEVDNSKFKSIIEPFTKDRIPYSFVIRFLFSCLVDADYLDTENFMSNGAVSRQSGDKLIDLLTLLNKHIAKWQNPSGKLNILRTQMLNECIEVGQNSTDKIFTLTVPTGGGKTISSMAFALNYAVKNSKRRIIYVIPYTSIIEQNAEVFRKIFGTKNILENHSNVDFKEIDEETKTQMMLAAENWDSPIVVTTAVQFFESFFSNKPSKCRKIHNIADSVVIFDEAQMLPLDYLLPCATAIRQLAENYNSAVVLCTATQPNFQSILNLTDKNGSKYQLTEICKSADDLTNDFKRVNFKYDGKLEDDEIVSELKQCNQVDLFIDTASDIQQRAATVLKNVHYVIEAHFDMTDKANQSDNPGKFQEMIKRRLNKGQCYHQPYLGCREFPAKFRRWEFDTVPTVDISSDLGLMLYDMDYSDKNNITPMYFRAKIQNGVLDLRDCEVLR